MTLDVAGEDEGVSIDHGQDSILENPARDATALTIAEVDTSTMPMISSANRPIRSFIVPSGWVSSTPVLYANQSAGRAVRCALSWWLIPPAWVRGSHSLHFSCPPDRVLPFEFNSRTKSDLCWNFLALCGYRTLQRTMLPRPKIDLHQVAAAQTEFWRQVRFCEV
jgi:hypothetical protein